MISHKHKCIFIHQRKVAGVSIVEFFGLRKTENGHMFNDGVLSNDGRFGYWKDRYEKYNDYFVFTAVRNPWDRFISGWKYLPDFKNEEIKQVIKKIPELRKNHKNQFSRYTHLARPQLDTLMDEDGIFVPDFVMRFESIDKDWLKVCNKLGIEGTLPHINKSKHEHYTEYYDEETKQLIANKFAKDIEYFEYKFGE